MRAIIHLAGVDFVLDLCAPDGASGNALRVKLGVEAFLRKIGLQPLRETSSVFAGVRDEHAQWFGRGHRLTDHHKGVNEETPSLALEG